MLRQNVDFHLVRFFRPFWLTCLALWQVALYLLPDFRPLGVPDGSVRTVQSVMGLSEPKARLLATVTLRALGLGVLGMLVALSFRGASMRRVAIPVLAATAVLAVAVKWFSFGYFPTRQELFFIVVVSILGGLFGLAIRRNRVAVVSKSMPRARPNERPFVKR